jgi:hypothetical protein
MLRACYLVAKRDPSVLVGVIESPPTTTAEESAAASAFFAARSQSKSKTNHFRFIEAMPSDLVGEYQEGSNRKDPIHQLKLFHHITNYVARSHAIGSDDEDTNLEPSAHLDVIITR